MTDVNAPARKRDHIELALQAQIGAAALDERFDYEPLLAAHPQVGSLVPFAFLGKQHRVPLWVSSMTGGTALAKQINHNLAKACKTFGFGMGLGSCRSLLYSDEHLVDFNVRDLMGDELPLYANLGIAQVEELLAKGQLDMITQLLAKLRADGLIVHVNPLQEWLQPEGDRLRQSPLITIEQLLTRLDIRVIVKEVGQGFGYRSMKALLQLPLEAVDFAAHGGTNFAKVELLRSSEMLQATYQPLARVGHSAVQMLAIANSLYDELGERLLCRQVIISGGIPDFLTGYYLCKKSELPAVYGQASAFLVHAKESYESLENYISMQVRGLELAHAYLYVR